MIIIQLQGSLAGVPGHFVSCGTTSEGFCRLQFYGPAFGERLVIATCPRLRTTLAARSLLRSRVRIDPGAGYFKPPEIGSPPILDEPRAPDLAAQTQQHKQAAFRSNHYAHKFQS